MNLGKGWGRGCVGGRYYGIGLGIDGVLRIVFSFVVGRCLEFV